MTPAIKWLERGFDLTMRKLIEEATEIETETGESILAFPGWESTWYTERFRPSAYRRGFYSIKEDDEIAARGL